MLVKFEVCSFECTGVCQGSAICAQTHWQTHISKSIRSASVHAVHLVDIRLVDGRRRESFLGPRDVWGPRHRSKILKRVFKMASF